MVLNFLGKGPVLFVGCHPDDVEYGCGGVISKIGKSVPIHVITLSKNEKNPNNKNVLKESRASLASLGIKKENIVLCRSCFQGRKAGAFISDKITNFRQR